jgi:hypothetical protein
MYRFNSSSRFVFSLVFTIALTVSVFAQNSARLSNQNKLTSLNTSYHNGEAIYMQVSLPADEAIVADNGKWQISAGNVVIAEGNLHNESFGDLRSEFITAGLPTGDYTWSASVYEGNDEIFNVTIPVQIHSHEEDARLGQR